MIMTKNKYLIYWLKLAAVFTIIVGLISSMASTTAGSGMWLYIFDLIKWPLNNDPSFFNDVTMAVNGILGGVMAGWGFLIYFLVGQIAKGQTELARYIIWSLLVWFVIDSTCSVLAGISLNIVVNLVFVAMYMPPLLYFIKKSEKK